MIGIVDYGLGNICAFINTYKRLNMPAKRLTTAQDFEGVSKLILPGVGAFDHAVYLLNQSGLRPGLTQLVVNEGVPVLGICVGMQLLASSSEEGVEPGLGWIQGKVTKIKKTSLREYSPLPHMGWNTLKQEQAHPLFNNIVDNAQFYFLHSYQFNCVQEKDVLGTTAYGDTISTVINSKNVYGIQCHPEKSHDAGLSFLKNFGDL